MALSEDQYEQLIAFFEGRLSPQEELDFLKAVSEDAALQQEFDAEMMLRAAGNPGAFAKFNEVPAGGAFEPAEAHLQTITAALNSSKQPDAPKAKLISLHQNKLWLRAAAAAAVAAIVIIGYLIFFNQKQQPAVVQQPPPAQQESPAQMPLPNDTALQPPKKNSVAKEDQKSMELYRRFYKKYKATDEDPIEASALLYAYDAGDYEKVLEASAEDFKTKGVATDGRLPEAYLAFYQGLSYLQQQSAAKAIEKFKISEDLSSGEIGLNDALLWYRALAYLQDNDVPEAKMLLQKLSTRKNSTYNQQAVALLRML